MTCYLTSTDGQLFQEKIHFDFDGTGNIITADKFDLYMVERWSEVYSI